MSDDRHYYERISEEVFIATVRNFISHSSKHTSVLVREYRVSSKTVDRWAQGKNPPHFLRQGWIVLFIQEHMRSCACNGE